MAKNARQLQKPDNSDLKRIKTRAKKAVENDTDHRQMTEDLYSYVIPLRAPASKTGKANTRLPGAKRYDKIFDTTAPKAAFRFAGRLQQDLTPPFQTFFNLRAGPGIEDGDQKKQFEEDLAKISKVVTAILNGSNFDTASHEMYLDLFGGQGCMLMRETNNRQMPMAFVSVPEIEIAITEDGFGFINGIYWEREFVADSVEEMWDGANIEPDLKKIINDTPDRMINIMQATEYDRKQKKWVFTAYWTDGKEKITENISNLSPWLTPRFFKVPGEAKGRGPGLMALGAIKTANKVKEFALKAAAFALLGLWQYRNDNVFNPATSPIMPGAFWKVQSTGGGSYGASVGRLPVPENFDVSTFVLEDLRNEIKQATFDDMLPPDAGAVRSATEIVERMKRLSQDLAGAYGRLNRELVRPLVQYVIDVANRNGMLQTKFDIDEILVSLEIISPIARGDQATAVENEVKWMELLVSLFGLEGAILMARVEELGPDWGRKLGVAEKYVRSEEEKTKLQQIAGQLVAAQQGANAPQQAGAEPVDGPPV